MFAPTYLDHNATAPLDARVLEAMLPYLRSRFGNPSSRHEYGRHARRAIDAARSQVAAVVGAHPTEVVFTGGGSEANNLFLKGAAACLRPGVVAISAIEHPSVREPARQLAARGWRLREIGVDPLGRVDADAFEQALAGARLVSVMLANNETGVIQHTGALAERARALRVPLHSDAVQALGRIPVDFRALGVSALSLSSHKIGGPQGAGALVLDKRIELAPLIAGGGQERGLRSGTENVAALVGFGLACELAVDALAQEAPRLRELRERIERGLASLGARVFGAGAERLPNTVFFALPGIDGETLVAQLDRAGFACASGSACSSASPEPSHALLAMGVAADVARGALRVSLGRGNDARDVERFLAALADTAARLKGMLAVSA
ncbi:MAG: cysteine desulfurase [Rhodocyclales bacterium CG17_big_fil_post_rev_8_21_14_2_50_68_7]|nr:MAG: cysteine desulfurase [Betaproteobacteria bacterium CG2_30_68_42]PIV76220.1 MAG: cysteine desulfurase [Rhodocyclales bacterium CG17_big_fil_post_rev_8_21_14_2_50_68_7]PIX74416.1 MAG: cysteine desulfurase [Rhodocyclales bacterium CG_4_10_14_3_um_filter_68_10]PJA58663.1 MAG: cysteine desulfurase [Rhodocyclales bacterium CG_4_9_14_3_um_filter_68_10]